MSATTNPLVSAIIPLHNGRRHIGEAIESVLHQDYGPVECIVVDDGSTDGSADIVARYPVRYISQAQSGPGAARNAGVKVSSGGLLAFLDQDDQWARGKLTDQVEVLQTDPTVGYVTTQQESRLDRGADRPVWITDEQLGNQSGFFPGMLLVTREVFEKVGPFREEFSAASDADWLFRAKDLRIRHVRVERLLLIRRLHDENQSWDVGTTHHDLLRIARDSIRRQSTVRG